MIDESNSLSPYDAARVLATLLVTPDDYLEEYRREFFDAREVPLERLEAARALTLAVARLLWSGQEPDWRRLDAGLAAVTAETDRDADGPAADDSTTTAPETVVDSKVSAHVEPATRLPPTRISAGGSGGSVEPSPWSGASLVAPPPAAPPAPAKHAAASTLASGMSPLAGPMSAAADTAPAEEVSVVMARPELPFQPNHAAKPPPSMAAELAPSASAGETVESGQMSPLASMGPMFLQGAAPKKREPAVELTIEQYASLQAMLEVHPNRRPATLESFGLADEAAYRAVSDHWSARLQADADLAKQVDALAAKYAAWIRTQSP